MKIVKLIKAKSTAKEYFFETAPPMTQAVMKMFNDRTEEKERHFQEKDGALVITRSQLSEMRQSSWSKQPVKVFEEFFSEIEAEIEREAENKRQNLEHSLAEAAKFIGVPLS